MLGGREGIRALQPTDQLVDIEGMKLTTLKTRRRGQANRGYDSRPEWLAPAAWLLARVIVEVARAFGWPW